MRSRARCGIAWIGSGRSHTSATPRVCQSGSASAATPSSPASAATPDAPSSAAASTRARASASLAPRCCSSHAQWTCSAAATAAAWRPAKYATTCAASGSSATRAPKLASAPSSSVQRALASPASAALASHGRAPASRPSSSVISSLCVCPNTTGSAPRRKHAPPRVPSGQRRGATQQGAAPGCPSHAREGSPVSSPSPVSVW